MKGWSRTAAEVIARASHFSVKGKALRLAGDLNPLLNRDISTPIPREFDSTLTRLSCEPFSTPSWAPIGKLSPDDKKP